jgi:cation:H+ antiporter
MAKRYTLARFEHRAMLPFLLILLGIFLLYLGGELLVRSVLKLAAAFGTSPLIVGLTVVAFGTSAPEVAVVVGAGLSGNPAIALGNVLGSNIANIGLILGLAVLVRPLVAKGAFLRRDLPFALTVSVLLLPLAWLVGLGRGLAALLLSAMAVYMWVLYRADDVPGVEEGAVEQGPAGGRLRSMLEAAVAMALLLAGAKVLVDAAVDVALDFGISERVIGLTVVAFGTSLPELAGCLAAVAKRQGEIVLGNVIGSNIFNTLFVLPIGLLVRPIAASTTDWIDMGVVVFFSGLIFVFLFHRSRMYRVEGALLLALYGAYVSYLFLQP